MKSLKDTVKAPELLGESSQGSVEVSSNPVLAALKNPYFLALRPKQWTKNLIVFAAPLFAFNINALSLVQAFQAFALFCCVSSSFYLINDILDVESDRRHPVKCKRPIAAGLVAIPVAIAMAAVLLFGALFTAWTNNAGLGFALTSYAILQVSYNLKLKHTVILDIVAIAIGFVLRAYAGAAATGTDLSAWFLLCTAMLALFLGIEKRKAELRISRSVGGKRRAVLARYTLPMLSRMESVVTTGTIMSYAAWSAGPDLNGASTPWMMLTLPFVIYGIFRYQLLSDPKEAARRAEGKSGKTERPEEVLLTDRPLLLTVLAWVMTVFCVLLLKQQGILP
ncbi:MAG TPA: decaprenyl-phosphate phosphoribosyltransferase [Leptolyngbyaceae cyanobacterium M33_DOE_097]|uniref:Decaprenyl-phosphate phosphoribosyltransferase n=1 Tax=Oscillatoriales cyanobacterium SpSt-418 TaxID=2282169 RepID=A0A7C3PKM3_9CYAN|nr:decaprenyl-phosphate phosphoribosyltransferase [Leptolyngbyaceae cyanobacterium M33_DOE_097]